LSTQVGRRAAKRAFDRVFSRRLLEGAARLIAVSPAEVTQYRAWGVDAGRIELVYNGLDLEEFAPLPPAGTFRQRLGIPETTRLVLFLGRLHPVKGIGTLIEAVAGLGAAADGAVALVIAGPDGGQQAHLEALARRVGLGEVVHFPGPLYGPDKLAAYADADVVASPGGYEIFGLVPFEALLCGTPVVVGAGSTAGQLIAGAGAGYAVPEGDVGALSGALLAVLADRAEARSRVEAGRAFVRRALDGERIVGQVESLYAQVVGRHG
jgi:glycosyltransferase involved in cell wall biosynthesis